MEMLRKISKPLGIFLAAVALISCCFIFTPRSVNVSAEEEKEEFSYALGDIASLLGNYLSDATKPGKGADGTPSGIATLDVNEFDTLGKYGDAGIQGGDAGAFVAYAGKKGWLASLTSTSSMNYSYASLKNIIADFDTKTTSDLLWQYATYGYALAELGLDKTANAQTFTFGTTLIGLPMFIMYVLTLGVSAVFGIVISVLKTLNPFSLLAAGVNATGLASWTQKMDTPTGTALTSLTGVIGQWYTAFYNFSWQIVVPICFVGLVVSALLFRNAWRQNGASKIKRYVIRIVFLCIGIPICGACYSGALNAMEKMTSSGNDSATRAVASTFLDFEAWAEKGRLTPPTSSFDGTGEPFIQVMNIGDKGSLQSESIANVRAMAYYINQTWAYQSLSGSSPFGNLNLATTVTDTGWNESADDKAANESVDNSTTNVHETLSMLSRYMSGNLYTASAYETKIKGELNKHTEYAGYIRDMFEFSSDLNFFYCKGYDDNDQDRAFARLLGVHRFRDMWDFYYDIVYDSEYENNAKDYALPKAESGKAGRVNCNDADGAGYPMPNIYGDGALSRVPVNGSNIISGFVNNYSGYGSIDPNNTIFDGLRREGGLSAMSMFNYLNTSFEDSDVYTYSSERASSALTRKYHKSVVLVGTGFTCVLYYFNCLILLGAFAIIGYFYAFSIIFSNLKRGLHLIMSVPMALLGAMRAIAKVVTYTVVMILEIVGTVFAYSLITELLMNVSGLIEAPMSMAIKGLSITSAGLGYALTCLTLLVSCVVYIWFIVMSMRFRKTIVKSLDEMASSVIDKFFETKAGVGSSGPGLVNKAANAIAAGAGAAMGNKLMDKVMTKNPGAADNVSTKSPDGGSGGGTDGESGADGKSGSEDGNENVSGSIAVKGDIDKAGNRLPGGDKASDKGKGDGKDGGGSDGNTVTDKNGVTYHNLEPPADKATLDSKAQSSDDADRALAGSLDESSSLADNPEISGSADTKSIDGADGAVDSVSGGSDDADSGQDAKDVNAAAAADSMSGKTSAMEEEANDDKKKEIAKETKKEAVKDAATGGAKAVTGAAKAYAGAHTGDAQMTAEGAKDMAEGTEQTAKAGQKAANANKDAKAQVNAEQNAKNRQKDGSSGQSGAKSVKSSSDGKPAARQGSGSQSSSSSSGSGQNGAKSAKSGQGASGSSGVKPVKSGQNAASPSGVKAPGSGQSPAKPGGSSSSSSSQSGKPSSGGGQSTRQVRSGGQQSSSSGSRSGQQSRSSSGSGGSRSVSGSSSAPKSSSSQSSGGSSGGNSGGITLNSVNNSTSSVNQRGGSVHDNSSKIDNSTRTAKSGGSQSSSRAGSDLMRARGMQQQQQTAQTRQGSASSSSGGSGGSNYGSSRSDGQSSGRSWQPSQTRSVSDSNLNANQGRSGSPSVGGASRTLRGKSDSDKPAGKNDIE